MPLLIEFTNIGPRHFLGHKGFMRRGRKAMAGLGDEGMMGSGFNIVL